MQSPQNSLMLKLDKSNFEVVSRPPLRKQEFSNERGELCFTISWPSPITGIYVGELPSWAGQAEFEDETFIFENIGGGLIRLRPASVHNQSQPRD